MAVRQEGAFYPNFLAVLAARQHVLLQIGQRQIGVGNVPGMAEDHDGLGIFFAFLPLAGTDWHEALRTNNNPASGTTDIATALNRVAQESAKQSVDAVVMVTDGGHNAPGDPREFTAEELENGIAGLWVKTDPRHGLAAERVWKGKRDKDVKNDDAPPEATVADDPAPIIDTEAPAKPAKEE